MTFRVDHASLRVTSLARACRTLDAAFGLRPTLSPHAPGRHSRLFFDRSYLEVAEAPVTEEESGSAQLYFFGFDRLEDAVARLQRAGLAHHSEPYRSADGVWDNLEVQAPPGVPAPILVRRTEPVEVAAHWPPPLPTPWPSGARAVLGFALRVTALEPAVAFFTALLGAEPPLRWEEPAGRRCAELRWPGGALILEEGAGPGVVAILLEVSDLGATQRFLQAQGTSTHRAPGPGDETLAATVDGLPGLRFLLRQRASSPR